MRRESAIDGRELLPHKRGRVDLALSRSVLLSSRQLQTEPESRLPIAVGFDFAKESNLGPGSDVSKSNMRSRRHVIVKGRSRDWHLCFQLNPWRRSVRHTDVDDLTIHFQRSEVLANQIEARCDRTALVNRQAG